jgi:hypothetical protein
VPQLNLSELLHNLLEQQLNLSERNNQGSELLLVAWRVDGEVLEWVLVLVEPVTRLFNLLRYI